MMTGENDFGDSLRETVYPPQPDPRMTILSFPLSDSGIAVECLTCVARHLLHCAKLEGLTRDVLDSKDRDIRPKRTGLLANTDLISQVFARINTSIRGEIM
jgi:hypothetical protein